MDAIKVLTQQHRFVEKLFEQFNEAEDEAKKRLLFMQLADNLAVHATIEERHFYPAVRDRQTAEHLEEAYDEHLEVKKLLLDALRSTEKPGFDGRVAALEGAVEHHVAEEEDELFPQVRKLMAPDALEAIGQQLEAEAAQLMSAGAPRDHVKVETEPPAVHP